MHFLTAKTTKQTARLLPLEIPFSEWACDVTQVKKGWECTIGEITFLAKIAYSTIVLVPVFFSHVAPSSQSLK